MVTSSVQSPQSGSPSIVSHRPQFGGSDSPLGHIVETPDVFERQATPTHPSSAAGNRPDAFAWVKDLVAEARTNPQASLPELLHASDLKRQANALLKEIRQSPPIAEVLSNAHFKETPEDLDALLAQANEGMAQLDSLLVNLGSGKPVSAPVLPAGHPLRAQFEKETAELKARQHQENVEQAKKYGIQDTPALRKELLEQGAVSSEAEIPAFLAKVGVLPRH